MDTQEIITGEFASKQIHWFEKKYGNEPKDKKILMRRTLNSGVSIANELRDIDFVELSRSLYFICQDLQADEFTRMYESQLELAGTEPEKFVRGLHKFFMQTSDTIKKKNLYQVYMDAFNVASRVRLQIVLNDPNRNSVKLKVINQYYSMLLQQSEYLKKDKYDMRNVFCGMTTTGEIISSPEVLPYFDVPSYEVEKIIRDANNKGIYFTMPEIIEKMLQAYQKNGFDMIKSIEDVEAYTHIDRSWSVQRCALSPYINEYTFDMLPSPDNPMHAGKAALLYALKAKDIDISNLEEKLRHRARTLPTNGVKYSFFVKDIETGEEDDCIVYKNLMLKEIVAGDRIIVLYKFLFSIGEMSGFYDTKDGQFFCILSELKTLDVYYNYKALVLYSYATQVLRDGASLIADFENHFEFGVPDNIGNIPNLPMTIKPFSFGGRLRKTYGKDDYYNPNGARRGNDNYEYTEKTIQGFVRKVGQGRTPSREAVERGLALGYDLASDETYVQPFIKSVLHLKRKE